MVRIRFGIYNTKEGVDQFLALMSDIMEKAKDLLWHSVPETINFAF